MHRSNNTRHLLLSHVPVGSELLLPLDKRPVTNAWCASYNETIEIKVPMSIVLGEHECIDTWNLRMYFEPSRHHATNTSIVTAYYATIRPRSMDDDDDDDDGNPNTFQSYNEEIYAFPQSIVPLAEVMRISYFGFLERISYTVDKMKVKFFKAEYSIRAFDLNGTPSGVTDRICDRFGDIKPLVRVVYSLRPPVSFIQLFNR